MNKTRTWLKMATAREIADTKNERIILFAGDCFHADGRLIVGADTMEAALRAILSIASDGKQGDTP